MKVKTRSASLTTTSPVTSTPSVTRWVIKYCLDVYMNKWMTECLHKRIWGPILNTRVCTRSIQKQGWWIKEESGAELRQDWSEARAVQSGQAHFAYLVLALHGVMWTQQSFCSLPQSSLTHTLIQPHPHHWGCPELHSNYHWGHLYLGWDYKELICVIHLALSSQTSVFLAWISLLNLSPPLRQSQANTYEMAWIRATP